MEFNFNNIIYFISYIAPILVTSLIILLGLLNNEAGKSMIFIGVVLSTYTLGVLLQKMINKVGTIPQHSVCNVFGNNSYLIPSSSTLIISSCLFYLLIPMIITGNFSYGILILLGIILLIDMVIKLKNKCTTGLGVFLGSIIGLIVSGGVTLGLYSLDHSLIMFGGGSSSSNNVTCNKPTNTQFKCSVYKNGKLIKQM